MLSFRQKIFINYLIIYFLLLAIIYPFASNSVKKIISDMLESRTSELLLQLQNAPTKDIMLQQLKSQSPLLFFRVGLIDSKRQVLYDSHLKRILGPQFSKKYVTSHPEVLEAFEKGYGYFEGYSRIIGRSFAYYAQSFSFQGDIYVLRSAFPLEYITSLSSDIKTAFFLLGSALLLLFCIITWLVMFHLSNPIKTIIKAITPQKPSLTGEIADFNLDKLSERNDEFGRLASTLSSLSKKVRYQINTLKHERYEKEVILESLVEGVVAVDKHMKVNYANNTFLTLLDLSFQDLIGQHFSKFNKPKCLELLIKSRQEHSIISAILTFDNKGQRMYLDAIAAPIEDKGGAILILQDKSAHYRLIEMRKEFITNASHELQTPITIIQGFAEALSDNPDLPQEQIDTITEKIMRNCSRMASLIKSLLTIADIEKLPLSRFLEFDITQLIDGCVTTLKSVHHYAKITIDNRSHEPLIITADPELLELAIMNLLTNAVRYSHQPANITITTDRQKEKITVSVADKGLGIAKEDLINIFHRFYRVDKTRSRRLGGSGLGLSIVETIIEKHMGTISVESTVGKGTTFTIFLPPSPPIVS